MSMESLGQLEHMVRGRVKTFLRHTWLVTILGTLILVGGVWLTIYLTTKATVMKVAVGPPDGIDARLVRVLGDRFVQDHDKIRLDIVSTDGPAQSAEFVTKNRADLAIVRGDSRISPDLPVIAILRQNVAALVVPAPGARGGAARKGKNGKAKFEKVAQLPGHRVGIVTGNDATFDLLKAILGHYGIAGDKIALRSAETAAEAPADKAAADKAPADKAPADKAAAKAAAAKAAADKAAAEKAAAAIVQVFMLDPKAVADAIRDDKVDVLFVAGPAGGHAIADVVAAATSKDTAPTFLEIDQAEAMSKRLPNVDSVDIDAGTFSGNPAAPDDTLKSLSFPQYLVAPRTFADDKIANLSRLIYASRLALADAMPGEVKIEAPSTDKDAPIIVHRGALAYLGDDQKSFFDKYGDQIFYGMLIFPVIGSMIAGAAGYFRADTRTRRLRLLKRLLDLTKKAHDAQTVEALDQVQVDADNLVVAVIHQTEREEFDDAARMSFSLAIDQARFAIAGRRAVLLERGVTAAASVAA